MGERDAAFINQSNHNNLNFSYDENNELTNVPMTKFSPAVPGKSSYYRFWSPYWAILENFGKIDKEMVLRKLTALHDIYDEHGAWYPYTRGSTFCTHAYNPTTQFPGGSYGVVVVVPETLEIYHVPMWPCRYTDKSWHYINLNDYKSPPYGPPSLPHYGPPGPRP